jgi:hypothetical protein
MFTLVRVNAVGFTGVVGHYITAKQCVDKAWEIGLAWWQYEIQHDGKVLTPGVNFCTLQAK